ncbi:tRNA guanosine(34) transglycosylase Tgt [Candidatus Roizmanbacteria bacterium]|nr:MAG: tRNA guanosine(34) transglycosylase Tgt [Candidatus Roizmanbacteria bacterium]
MFTFDITARLEGTKARSGIFHTPHREIQTPELAIVATEGEIRSVPRELWKDLPNQYFIVNTYHTHTKKLVDTIQAQGGVHGYMGLGDRAFATDSGGFQVFSLGFGQKHNIGKLARDFAQDTAFADDDESPLTITEEGVSFTFDGKEVRLTPESSMDIQHQLGADIMFAFDECTSPLNSEEYTRQSMERTHRWLKRCISAHREHEEKQALFGIVQGGEYRSLREESARVVGSMDVPGFGLGGSLGKFKEDVHAILDWIIPILPDEKPRHFLGIGQIRDIFESVERGVDLFDCVIPTREARHRMLYTEHGRVSIRKMRNIDEVPDKNCSCYACKNDKITYPKLWELFLARDPRAAMYATIHNVWFYAQLTQKIRNAIGNKTFIDLKEEVYKYY